MLLIAGVSNGCKHQSVKAPAPPVVEFNLHDEPNRITKCAMSNGKKCEGTAINLTNNWIMLKPSEWQKIQNYNDTLICIIEGGCKSPANSKELTPQMMKDYFKSLKKTVHTLRVRQ